MSWSIQTWSGSAWSVAATLDNPWEVEPVFNSTDKVSKLANGKEGRVTSGTKSKKVTRISWDMKTNTFASTISGYVTNGTILKLTDHNGNTYVGKIDQLSTPHKLVSGVTGNAVSITLTEVDDPA